MANLIDVQNAMEGEGFRPDSVIADGKVHRFDRDGKKKVAWYCLFQNTSNKGELFYVCTFGDWREPDQERKFISSFVQTKHDKKVIDEQLREAQRKREQEQLRAWEETAHECAERWKSLDQSGISEYMSRKHLPSSDAYGIRFDRDFLGTHLFVPVRDVDDKLWGWQKIQPDGSKYFFPGTKKKGNFHALGDWMRSDIIYVCEGFATACTVFEATQKATLIAFDAGNLISVCESIRRIRSDAPIIVAGDDDRFNVEGNPGVSSATNAAKASLGKAIFPKFKDKDSKGTDWNDLATEEGIDEVKRQLSGVIAEKHYIKPLGYNEGTYYYTSSSNPQISRTYSHDSTDLLKLMPREYWETLYPTKKGVDWESAKSDLMLKCRSKGFFLEKNIRGIGVWEDEGKAVINLGDRIYYGGREHHTHDIVSKNFYTIGERVGFLSEQILTTAECKPILDVLKLISVKNDQQRIFLGGWIVISVLSGVLTWRPHLWLTGEPGSGKSTVIRDFISRLQCGLVRRVAKNSTEAGIRQLVRHDAVPVLYDEFETKNQRTLSNIEACMELICQASTDDSGQVIKGGSDGNSQVYTPRFCALVSSIRPTRLAGEEESRFTFVEIDKEQNNLEQWETVQKLLGHFDDAYCSKFVSRTISLFSVLKANERVFKRVLGSRYPQRVSQQYAPILAGWCLLSQETVVTESAAKGFLDIMTFDSPLQSVEADYDACLGHLLRKKVRCTDGEERVIRQLLQDFPREPVAKKTLFLYGLSVVTGLDKKNYLFLEKNNPELQTLFQNSNWMGGWIHSLKRTPGAQMSTGRIDGFARSGLKIPMKSEM